MCLLKSVGPKLKLIMAFKYARVKWLDPGPSQNTTNLVDPRLILGEKHHVGDIVKVKFGKSARAKSYNAEYLGLEGEDVSE